MTQHITVLEYIPKWEQIFAIESKLIREILGDNCVAIHHIGSTAVKGLAAKPIIDIMPIVKEIEDVDKYRLDFQEIGYECLDEFGIPGRRYLRKGGDERTHQIHIFSQDNKTDIERHLAVRDYLNNNKDIAIEYGKIKKRLASLYPYDIDRYCDGKENFMKSLEEKALSEKHHKK